MESNPIKYSDLIQDDGAIKEAIAQLGLLLDSYKELIQVIKTHAKDLQSSIKTASGATEEGRQTTKKALDDTQRLEKAQRELQFAYSDIAAEVAKLKVQLSDRNSQLKSEATATLNVSTSYKEMKAQLELLIAQYRALTREEALNSQAGQSLIKQIQSLRASIKELDTATKASTASSRQSTQTTKQAAVTDSDLDKAKRKLAQATSEENVELLTLMAAIKEANQIAKLNAIIAREQEGSYNRLSAQYSLNKIALNKMSEGERTATASGKQLVSETNAIYQSMIRLQEATGKHTLSVGNYKKAWDGVGMGVNQIVRELPVLGISLNTFFLGISNNVPILIDEINKARVANQVAAAAGEKTVSIYKSITSAIFGWNTALVVVLSVLAIYGRQILEFIFSTEEAEKAVTKLKIAEEYLGEARNDAGQNGQKELVRLKLLYEATQNVLKPMDKRLKAAEELKRLYPQYLKHLSTESILAGEASAAYLALAGSIIKAARSRAYEDKIVANEKEIIDLNDQRIGRLALIILKNKEIAAAEANLKEARKQEKDEGLQGAFVGTYEKEIERLKKERTVLTQEENKILEQIDEINKASQRLATGIDAVDLIDPVKKPKGRTPKDPKDRTEEIERANLAIRKKYAESVTALELDELIKQANQLQDTYDAESAMLMNKYKNDKDLTEESRDLILKIIQNWAIKLGRDAEEIVNQITQRQLEKDAELWQLKLDATKEGSVEELAIRLNMLENERQQELVANKMLIEAKRQDEKLINKKWDEIIKRERDKSLYEIAMEDLRIQQEYYKSEFDLLRNSEREKTKFKLKQEKERWQKILALAKQGQLDLTDLEIKTIENLIKKIDQDMADMDGKFDFYSLFGLDPSDEEREAVNEILSTTLGYLQEALASEIELADMAIEKAQERVDAKQKALEDEIEMRNKGYAFNVTQAQKELDVEKKMLQDANKEKAKLVKAQQQLDTVAQASSLITAAANIWSVFSKLGPIGMGLAVAGIGLMFGSFAIAKMKAAQVTKEQAKVYGEGGFEELQGGSHQSGNDINIGRTGDGRERRAEGGEGLAIIAKSKMKKYGKLVPNVVEAINKGVFEKVYSKAFSHEGIKLGLTYNNIDMSVLEEEVKAIRRQNEKRTLIDKNGNLIVFYKNLKVTYKS